VEHDFTRSELRPTEVWIASLFAPRLTFHALWRTFHVPAGTACSEITERTECGLTVLTPEEAPSKRRRGALLPAAMAKSIGAKPCTKCWRKRSPDYGKPHSWVVGGGFR
jgi:hypothetical protein